MVISSFLRDSFSANGNHKLSFCLCGFVSSGSGPFVNENSWKEGVSAKRGWDVAGPELTTVSQLALAPRVTIPRPPLHPHRHPVTNRTH